MPYQKRRERATNAMKKAIAPFGKNFLSGESMLEILSATKVFSTSYAAIDIMTVAT
jgi:hypothetical protein